MPGLGTSWAPGTWVDGSWVDGSWVGMDQGGTPPPPPTSEPIPIPPTPVAQLAPAVTTRDALLGAGFAYPGMLSGVTGGVLEAVGADSVRASLRRLFDTAPGEQLFVPEYGSVLKYLVFENDIELFRAMCVVAVVEAIQRWEPRVAAIRDLTVDADETEGAATIRLSLTVQLVDGRVVSNIVHQLNRA